MAEACTITEETIGSVKKIKWAWTSAADGTVGAAAVSSTTTNAYSGECLRLITDPGATAPTDDYDVVINDADGVDVLIGAGANRDATATEQVIASSLGCVANDTLTLLVTNAGSGKTGTTYLYIR